MSCHVWYRPPMPHVIAQNSPESDCLRFSRINQSNMTVTIIIILKDSVYIHCSYTLKFDSDVIPELCCHIVQSSNLFNYHAINGLCARPLPIWPPGQARSNWCRSLALTPPPPPGSPPPALPHRTFCTRSREANAAPNNFFDHRCHIVEQHLRRSVATGNTLTIRCDAANKTSLRWIPHKQKRGRNSSKRRFNHCIRAQ